MSQTNTWSSKAWFKAAGEHFNNAKSSLPEVNKQTGMNFVVSTGWGLAYSKEWKIVKIPGQLAAAPVKFAKSTLEWPCSIVGNRAAIKDTTQSITEANQSTNAQPPKQDNTSVTRNQDTKDWQTVANMADKASGALVNLGTGIGLYAFSNGITTAVNSLIEGKGIKKSLGNGLHEGKSTIQNTCYGIVEGVAAAVDLGVGTTLLCCEATGFLIDKAWNNTLGRLPHDNESTSDIPGDIIDTDQA